MNKSEWNKLNPQEKFFCKLMIAGIIFALVSLVLGGCHQFRGATSPTTEEQADCYIVYKTNYELDCYARQDRCGSLNDLDYYSSEWECVE